MCLQWGSALKQSFLPYLSTMYTNSSGDQPGSRVLFPHNLDKLRKLKQLHDPLNTFSNNHNIVPADMDVNTSQCFHPRV